MPTTAFAPYHECSHRKSASAPRGRALIGALLAAASLVRAEDLRPPADDLAPAGAEAQAVEEKIGLGFLPVPEIILDPTEGNTYGLLGVWLWRDDQNDIKYLVAPDVRYNATKGVFPSFRLFGYPSGTERYAIQLGKSTTIDETYEFEYVNRGLWDERAFVLGHLLYERDSTERFWGFGNESPESGESNYTGDDFRCDVTPGVWVLPHANVSYRMRIRRYGVRKGQVDGEPFIGVAHPGVRDKGLEPSLYWQHRLTVAWDSRDSIDMPTRGTYLGAYVDGADRHLGSHTSFVAFGFEWRDFVPLRGEQRNPVLALRALLDYLQGGTDTPFWLRNSLGGRRYLRGYGSHRFTDFNRALVGAELRTRVYERTFLGVRAELEVAPFVEAGQVFRRLADSPVDDPHWVGGMGFRIVVRPQLVAFVDVGYGGEGEAIFTGIDYPF